MVPVSTHVALSGVTVDLDLSIAVVLPALTIGLERRKLQTGKENGEMIEDVVLIFLSLMVVVPLSAIQTVPISAVLSGVSAVVMRNTVDVLSVFLMQNEKLFGHTNVLYCTVLNCIV